MKHIVIDTAAQMLRHHYQIRVWCLKCERQADFDLEAFVRQGRGDESMIRRRWRCTVCGGAGRPQMSFKFGGLPEWQIPKRDNPAGAG